MMRPVGDTIGLIGHDGHHVAIGLDADLDIVGNLTLALLSVILGMGDHRDDALRDQCGGVRAGVAVDAQVDQAGIVIIPEAFKMAEIVGLLVSREIVCRIGRDADDLVGVGGEG